MSSSDRNKTIYLNNELPSPTNHIPLISLVWHKNNDQELNAVHTIKSILKSACGPYGSSAVTGGNGNLAWGILLPDNIAPLTCWSKYINDKELCLVEGDFYNDLPGLKLHPGDNPEISRQIAYHMRKKTDQLNALNGAYSGIYVDLSGTRAYAFCDQTGSRPVFWYSDERHFIVSNNFWSFRGIIDVINKRDSMAISQILIFGIPLMGRTLIEGVRQLFAGHHVCSTAEGNTSLTKLDKPVERKQWSFDKTINMLRESTDETMKRISSRLDHPVGLGLSGGLDSRILLSSLYTQNIKHTSFTSYISPDAPDNYIAKNISAMTGLPQISMKLDSALAFSLYRDLFIINESGSPGFGYFLLCAGAQSHTKSLMIGSEISRSTPMGPHNPLLIKNKIDLSHKLLKAYMNFLSPSQAYDILDARYRIDWLDILGEWKDSFNQIYQPTVFDTYLEHRIYYRLQRRTHPRHEAARWFCQPIYPYMDRNLTNIYRNVPLQFLKGERAHIKLLCNYKTGLEHFPNAARNFTGISLKKEYKYRHIVHLGRIARLNYLLPLIDKYRSMKGKTGLGKNRLSPVEEVETGYMNECEIFNTVNLQRLIDKYKKGEFVNKAALRKIFYLLLTNDFFFGSDFTGSRSFQFLQKEKELTFLN